MNNGLHIDSLQFKNFMSVGNVLQTVNFENGNLRIITGEDLDSPTLKRSGIGKAQPTYSKVKVNNGWKNIGDIRVGNLVMTPQGTETVVTGVYPQGKKAINKIVLEDGRSTKACNEHLWKVFTKEKQWHLANTEEIKEYLKNGISVYNTLIEDRCDSEYDFKIDPYLLALFMVAGEVNDAGYLQLNILDTAIESNVTYILDEYEDTYVISNSTGFTIFEPHKALADLLIDYSSIENIIDFICERGSFSDHRRLLQGILDIHGYDDDSNYINCVFTSDQRNLAVLTQKLAWSCGGVAVLKKNIVSDEIFNIEEEYHMKLMFKSNNDFVNLMYKKVYGDNVSPMVKIAKIEESGEYECVCIKVLNDEHLYVTDNFIVTHNTTIPNALSYAIYNKPVADIRTKRLPNKTNVKGMFVRVDFRKNGKRYYIERGIKPDVFKFVEIDGTEEKERNDTQGTKNDTQTEIERIIGMSHELFTMIVTINTLKNCFMKQPLAKQRDLIEEILNIAELTRKSKILSEYRIKESKLEIEKEKVRIESSVAMKKRAEEQLASHKRQYEQWIQSRNNQLVEMYTKLDKLRSIDIDEEIEKHNRNKLIQESSYKRKQLLTEKSSTENLLNQGVKRLTEIENMLESFKKNVCPTCEQDIENDSHKAKEEKLKKEANEYFVVLEEAENKIKEYKKELEQYPSQTPEETFYRDVQDAYNHQHSLTTIKENIDAKEAETNPYEETIKQSNDMLVESVVSYDTLEELEKRLNHQLFLQKMLTGRDSFIRKRIIDISLPVLNANIEKYLRKTNIRHEMKFQSDLTLEIYKAGEEYDFEQLSRGEQNWAIIALNLAMRDLYEELFGSVNLVFVDELIDFGMDLGQSIDAFKVLKSFTRDNNKSVSLITHREELFEKADELLYTLMENEFTSYETRVN